MTSNFNPRFQRVIDLTGDDDDDDIEMITCDDLRPPSVAIAHDGVEIFRVERILQMRECPEIEGNEYLVKWFGYPVEEASWQPIENLGGCAELLLAFARSCLQH